MNLDSTDLEQHKRKEFLYDGLVRRALRRGGGYLYVHREHGTEWLLSKEEVNDEYWVNALQEGLAELLVSGYIIKSV